MLILGKSLFNLVVAGISIATFITTRAFVEDIDSLHINDAPMALNDIKKVFLVPLNNL